MSSKRCQSLDMEAGFLSDLLLDYFKIFFTEMKMLG